MEPVISEWTVSLRLRSLLDVGRWLQGLVVIGSIIGLFGIRTALAQDYSLFGLRDNNGVATLVDLSNIARGATGSPTIIRAFSPTESGGSAESMFCTLSGWYGGMQSYPVNPPLGAVGKLLHIKTDAIQSSLLTTGYFIHRGIAQSPVTGNVYVSLSPSSSGTKASAVGRVDFPAGAVNPGTIQNVVLPPGWGGGIADVQGMAYTAGGQLLISHLQLGAPTVSYFGYLNPTTGQVTTYANWNFGSSSPWNYITDIAIHPKTGQIVGVARTGADDQLVKITLVPGQAAQGQALGTITTEGHVNSLCYRLPVPSYKILKSANVAGTPTTVVHP